MSCHHGPFHHSRNVIPGHNPPAPTKGPGEKKIEAQRESGRSFICFVRKEIHSIRPPRDWRSSAPPGLGLHRRSAHEPRGIPPRPTRAPRRGSCPSTFDSGPLSNYEPEPVYPARRVAEETTPGRSVAERAAPLPISRKSQPTPDPPAPGPLTHRLSFRLLFFLPFSASPPQSGRGFKGRARGGWVGGFGGGCIWTSPTNE